MINISDIVTASYRTSKEADIISKELKKYFGSEANYEVARLAIGRSLSISEPPPPSPDGNGMSLKGMQLFGGEEEGNYLWISLLGEQLRLLGREMFSIDDIQKLVRDHWHRGALTLKSDWTEAEENFPALLELLCRKAALPETRPINDGFFGGSEKETDFSIERASKEDCDNLTKVLTKMGISAEIRDSAIGPRIIRYTIFLPKTSGYALLFKKNKEICFALGEGKILTHGSNEPQTCFLDFPKEPATWSKVDDSFFNLSIKFFADHLLPVSPGVDVVGKPVVFDLSKSPHLLIGGTTGSGKSVCLNSIILGLVISSINKPIKLALIDPKQVEFTVWKGCKCLYREIADNFISSIELLDDLVEEMERRFSWLKEIGAKDIIQAAEKGFVKDWIIVCVDELADLIMYDSSIEDRIVQLAQKSRAAGIHLILATQRPDAETFSGLLRSNCPSRIALKVQKATESKIILDDTGAESLLGSGDMLIKDVGFETLRAHGYYISNSDIENFLHRMV